MSYEHKDIDELVFNFMSQEEIKLNSVCEITESKLEGPGSLYDPLMGLYKQGDKCVTCGYTYKECEGHFGRITLSYPVLHPASHKIVICFLTVQCRKCFKCIIKKGQLKLDESKIFKKKRMNRLLAIYALALNVDICQQDGCGEQQPKYIKGLNNDNNNIYYYYGKKTTTKMKMTPEEIYNQFKRFEPDTLELLGLDMKRDNHPCNYIITVLPVSPPVVRPPVDMGEICHDDLTFKLVEIIKINNKLKNDPDKKQELIDKLEFHIYTMFDNSAKKAKQHNGKPIQGVKQRLIGKSGRIRGNLCGKRVDFTGRTVIGPDPSLPYDVVVIPPTIAKKMTKPEIISKLNIDDIIILINNGKCNYLFKGGDIDSNPYNLNILLKPGGFKLQEGDIIERPIKSIKCDKQCESGVCDIHKSCKDIIINKRDKCNYVYVKYKTINPYKYKLLKGKEIELKKGDRVFRGKEVITNFTTYKKKFCDKKYSINIDKTSIKLEYGDIVERQLMDEEEWKKLIPNSTRSSDRITINRQPSLHIGSIMSFKIKILPGSSMRMNLAVTKSFNADQ